jgi:uncharacterized protein (DUF1800 family)
MLRDSILAAIRFGLGPRPDQPVPADASAWLKGQIRGPVPEPPLPEGWERMPTATDGLTMLRYDQMNRTQPDYRPVAPALYRQEAAALMQAGLTTTAPFRERLVLFWSNHLSVSAREGNVRPLAGDYIRTAIRPHVAGRFEDMLVAAIHHPAMLYYLNQASSIGPGSPLGQRVRRGLNENLAREVLELHTLSPASGYTQADVTEFARLLTGLGVEVANEPIGSRFLPAAHEPGAKTILGHRFEEGPEQIDAALRWLGRHEATHRHLALKLARHFVADVPPQAVVNALYAALRDTGGDLGAVAEALVDLPQAWDQPLGKLRAPQDFVLASLRVLGAKPELAPVAVSSVASLNQAVWLAPAPIGWPDHAECWLHPEGMIRRMELAYSLAGRFSRLNPNDLVPIALGPHARPDTIRAIKGAGSVRDGLTLLLASPEFQRR